MSRPRSQSKFSHKGWQGFNRSYINSYIQFYVMRVIGLAALAFTIALAFSLGIAFAEEVALEEHDDSSTGASANSGTGSAEADADTDASADTNSGTGAKVKAAATVRVKALDIRALNAERQDKILALNQERQDKLANLRQEHLEKVSGLNQEYLEKIAELRAEKVRKLAGLEKEKLEFAAKLSEEELEKLSSLGRARMHAIVGADTGAEVSASLGDVKVVPVAAGLFKARNIARAELDKARERIEELRLKIEEKRQMISEKRQELLGEKEKYKECLEEEEETEECAELKASAFAHAKEIVINVADHYISNLEKVKERIAESDDISAEAAAAANAELDASIEVLLAAKAKAEAATTVDELREAAKELKHAWADSAYKARLHAFARAKSAMREVVQRGIHIEARIEKLLERASEAGIDTSLWEADLTEISQLVADARASFEASAALHSEAIGLKVSARADGEVTDEEKAAIEAKLEEAKAKAEEARTFMEQAHEKLKALVKDIVSQLKAKGEIDVSAEAILDSESSVGEIEAEEIEEVEEEVEVEAEAEAENELEVGS